MRPVCYVVRLYGIKFQSHVPLAVILHSLWGIGNKLSGANIGLFCETSKSFPSFFIFGRKKASRHFSGGLLVYIIRGVPDLDSLACVRLEKPIDRSHS